MSVYETRRLLKRLWRTEGNPRLKGLLLAGFDGGPSQEEVGKAWLTDPEERKRQLQHLSTSDGRRVLAAPVSQQYAPAIHEGFEDRRESSVARSLAKAALKEDEAKKFLAGERAMDKDGYIRRALLQDSVTELDTLFREELETTLIQGAAPRKWARDAMNVINVNRRKGDLPRGSDETFAPKVAQGATIGASDQGYDTVPYEAEKYAAGWEITNELMRESEVDVAEAEIRHAGARVENAVNRVGLVNLVDNANKEHDEDHGGSNELGPVKAINAAITEVEVADFMVDTGVFHPRYKEDLFGDTNLIYANRAGTDDVIRNRTFNPILGIEMFTGSDATYNDADQSNSWGYTSDGEMGAVLFQQEHAALVIWDDFDMETEDYDDPIRDLQGGNVRTYADSVFRQGDSAARIEY